MAALEAGEKVTEVASTFGMPLLTMHKLVRKHRNRRRRHLSAFTSLAGAPDLVLAHVIQNDRKSLRDRDRQCLFRRGRRLQQCVQKSRKDSMNNCLFDNTLRVAP